VRLFRNLFLNEAVKKSIEIVSHLTKLSQKRNWNFFICDKAYCILCTRYYSNHIEYTANRGFSKAS